MSVASHAQIPVVRRATTTTVTVGIVRVRSDGEELVHEQQVCSVEVHDRNPFARTSLPDALVRTLPSSTARVDATGGRYVVDLGTGHLGYDPQKSGGLLPRDPADPAVLDADGDGRPGVTVTVTLAGMGDYGLEVVQRSRAVLDGAWSDGAIRGVVRTVDFEQVVLAADHPWLRRTPDIQHDPGTFTLTRLEPGATCADLLAGG